MYWSFIAPLFLLLAFYYPSIVLVKKNISHFVFTYELVEIDFILIDLVKRVNLSADDVLLNYLRSMYSYHIVTSHLFCHSVLLVYLWVEHWLQID